MLAVDFLEFLHRRGGFFFVVEQVESLIIEPVGRLVRRQLVLVEPTRTGA
jgi:hypothetical protein